MFVGRRNGTGIPPLPSPSGPPWARPSPPLSLEPTARVFTPLFSLGARHGAAHACHAPCGFLILGVCVVFVLRSCVRHGCGRTHVDPYVLCILVWLVLWCFWLVLWCSSFRFVSFPCCHVVCCVRVVCFLCTALFALLAWEKAFPFKLDSIRTNMLWLG